MSLVEFSLGMTLEDPRLRSRSVDTTARLLASRYARGEAQRKGSLP